MKKRLQTLYKGLEEDYEKSTYIYTKENNQLMLVGDFNGKIGIDENRITNGDTSITPNDRRIRSMVRALYLRHFKQTCQM